jgi:hypothetical protein
MIAICCLASVCLATDRPHVCPPDLENFGQDHLFLTDEMLYNQSPSMQLCEEEYDRALGSSTSRLQNPLYESTPPHAGHRPQSAPNTSRPSLKDIYTEQNARLQSWALRSQACMPLTLSDQMESAYDGLTHPEDPFTPSIHCPCRPPSPPFPSPVPWPATAQSRQQVHLGFIEPFYVTYLVHPCHGDGKFFYTILDFLGTRGER